MKKTVVQIVAWMVVIASSGGCAREGTMYAGPDQGMAALGDVPGDIGGPEADVVPVNGDLPQVADVPGLPDSVAQAEVREDGVAGEIIGNNDILVDPDQVPSGEPKILCEEGSLVEPQELLHLVAWAGDGNEGATYKWKVRQPDGSVSLFQPNDSISNPTFAPNVAGNYSFMVEMWDGLGAPIPPPDPFDIEVIPGAAIHVELLWHTPGDADESDTGPDAGSDMDLHFTHPWANQPDTDGDGLMDPWFDNLFDCFWFNTNPNWGSYQDDINDNPALDLDDTDGAGPENLNLHEPESVPYQVGVHFWNEHGYGESEATVRVYIDGELAATFGPVMLVDEDMWHVCQIHGGTMEVLPVANESGEPKIFPKYSNPYFYH